MTKNLEIREVEAGDLATFKEVRLEALLNHPEAFASTYEGEKRDSDEKWLERIAASDGRSNITYLAFVDGNPAGMAGIFCGFSPKTRHSGTIWGVYLRPQYRGQGIATRLLEACAAWAREGTMRILKLGVVTTNTAAIKCYTNYGFQVYGLEPKALFVNNRYYDELLMVKTI